MKILIIDESTLFWRHLRDRFGAQLQGTCAEYTTTVVEIETDYEKARELLRIEGVFDAVVINPKPLSRPPELALEIIAALFKNGTVTVAVPVSEDVKNCVDCMRAGASDYIPRIGASNTIADAIVAALTREMNARKNDPDADAAFVQTNFDALLREHAGRWIAVAGGRFLDAADTHHDLQEAVAVAPPIGPVKFWRMPKRWDEGTA